MREHGAQDCNLLHVIVSFGEVAAVYGRLERNVVTLRRHIEAGVGERTQTETSV
jgi:hypothetical protein